MIVSEKHHAGRGTLLTTIGVAWAIALLTIAAPAAADALDDARMLNAVIEYGTLEYEHESSHELTSSQWINAVPADLRDALVLVTTDKVVVGRTITYRTPTASGRIVVDAISLTEALPDDALAAAQAIIEHAGATATADTGPPAERHTGDLELVHARLSVTQADGTTATSAVVLTANRRFVLRLTASGDLGDAEATSMATYLATRLARQQRPLDGPSSPTVTGVNDISRALGLPATEPPTTADKLHWIRSALALTAALIAAFILFGPNGKVTKQLRSERPTVSNYQATPTPLPPPPPPPNRTPTTSPDHTTPPTEFPTT